uniref:Helitron_like_N domain-containing protein n=1 Tax=Steinernema glaseri TaxID=37863 RepID=A0A1I8AW13_9BILA
MDSSSNKFYCKYPDLKKMCKLSSIWGRIVNRKQFKQTATLNLYMLNDKEVFWHAARCRYIERLSLANLEQFKIRYIVIWDGKQFKQTAILNIYMLNDKEVFWHAARCRYIERLSLANLEQFKIRYIVIWDGYGTMREDPSYQPLTETNCKLLKKYLLNDHPYGVTFYAKYRYKFDHPLVRQLCLAPNRVTEILMRYQAPTSLDVLTRSVTRGTLRSLGIYTHPSLSNELLQVLLEFVASVQMDTFSVNTDSPLSYMTLLFGVVDAFLSRERAQRFTFKVNKGSEQIFFDAFLSREPTQRFTFKVNRGSELLCERLHEAERQGRVRIEYILEEYSYDKQRLVIQQM